MQTGGGYTGSGQAGMPRRAWLMARRSAQSVLKRAREQAVREKRELKQAKKDARAAERRRGSDPSDDPEGINPGEDAG